MGDEALLRGRRRVADLKVDYTTGVTSTVGFIMSIT